MQSPRSSKDVKREFGVTRSGDDVIATFANLLKSNISQRFYILQSRSIERGRPKPWRDAKVISNLHWDGYGKDHQTAGTNATIAALVEVFHDYGLLWTPEEYVFYMDGKEVWRTRAEAFRKCPNVCCSVKKSASGAATSPKAQLRDCFEVDYVRVYELTATATGAGKTPAGLTAQHWSRWSR